MSDRPEAMLDVSPPAGRWLQPLDDWPAAVRRKLQSDEAVVRVVVASVRGSAPRECGACMLIGRSDASGTIGGGHLEWAAIDAARTLLDEPTTSARVQKFVLGSDLAQCCGGAVEVWIERFTRADLQSLEAMSAARRRGSVRLISRLTSTGIDRSLLENGLSHPASRTQLSRTPDAIVLTEVLDAVLPTVSLYGAGHVGQALAKVLAMLPVRARWIDSRREYLPEDIGQSLAVVHAPEPLLTLASAAAQSHFIVMTHNHALDYALCRAILQRGDFASIGVIGSQSKAAKFRSRLARDGLSAAQIAPLRCPVGIDALHSKVPAVIAIAIAAQLLQTIEARAALAAPQTGSGAIQPCDASGKGCVACELLHQSL